MDSPYSQLYIFDFEKKKIYPTVISTAVNYLKKINIDFEKPNKDSDKEIYKKSQSDLLNADPLLCLRCRVSKAIYFECKDIYENNRDKVDLFDLSRIVLIDDGKKFLRIRNNKGDLRRYLINFSFLEKNEIKIKLPIFLEIIRTFNYERSNLNTWTKRLVKGNSEIKNYMSQVGIKFIKKWAKIADTSTKRIKNSLINYGINTLLVDELICLHESYKKKYKEAKINHFAKYNTQLGWEPSEEFLKSLDPPQDNEDNFKLMEEALNCLYQPKIESFSDSNNDPEMLEIEFTQSCNENKFKVRSLKKTINKCSYLVIREVLNKDQKKWKKDEERRKCWSLYSKGISQREIAKKCNHKQAWVSKLIRENFLGELIANDVLVSLKNKQEFINITKIPEELDTIKKLIRDYIISIKDKNNRSYLMQLVEEELKK